MDGRAGTVEQWTVERDFSHWVTRAGDPDKYIKMLISCSHVLYFYDSAK